MERPYILVDSLLDPKHPDFLIEHAIYILAVRPNQEVVDPEYLWWFGEHRRELQIFLEIRIKGSREEIQVRHRVELTDPFGAQRRRSSLGLERRAFRNHPVNPVERLLHR